MPGDDSYIVNVWMPACFSLTPAAIPPKPAPMMTTRGVPAGPNNVVADGRMGREPGYFDVESRYAA